MAPQIIDLTGSDDELTSVPQSRRVDETLLRQPILPATPFRILPPLHPKSVSIIPPPKRRKINEGNVKILPREPVIGSVPNNAIVIDDDDDESVPSAGPRNVEIQTQSIFPPPTNAIVRRARANRLGTSAPRVSRKGKIQKPSRREGPILINHEFHGKMVSALKHQVFVHIQTALASYMDILGRPTCNDIGSKVRLNLRSYFTS
ncbi:hypothetical protein F5884DRAFT_51515 [Xylogone sp. PMI_703]|nr:hypothetical protein F5884DRAFT_51515 [Xylogone sp. PMI_703]